MLDFWIKILVAILLGSAVLALVSTLVFSVINHYKNKAMKNHIDKELKRINKKEKDDGLI